jgi:putative nucleotidyltransferase with HDIG domain
MISAVESLLRDLQGAVSARQLYPADHPRLVELVHRVVEQTDACTKTHPEIGVFRIDGRVVFDGTPMPGSESLARGLFATLLEYGFHRITLQRGLTAAEITTFVEQVAASSHGQRGHPVQPSPHLRLSALEVLGPRPDGPASTASVPFEGQASLERVWKDVTDRRLLDFDALEFLLLALARTVDRSLSAVIPLAALKAHDDYTVTHIVNVALLSMALGETLGFPAGLVKEVGLAALLHDVGKLSVPADVLNATGRLTDEQRTLIRRHPELGARILLTTPGVPELAVTVAFEHHLQYDGGGYPAVPRGWKVNLASEITHIADVFDALRSNRPYRAALTRDRIAEMMMKDAGTVFDPDLVRTFLHDVVPHTTA